MNNKSKFNIIAGLAMIFLFVTSCDTEKEDVPEKGDEIQKVEIPSSDATNPIVAGQMIVIHGEDFTENSEIWIQPSTVTKAEGKEMKAEIAKVQAERAKADSNKLLMALKEYNGVNVIVGKIQAANMDELRNNADLLCNKFDKAGVVVLGAILNDKVNFVVKVNKDGVARGLHAGKIVKEVAMVTGGNGGGRPDMAQAGGKQPEKLNDAFAKAHEVIQSQIK